jgi:iron complex outermembrane recepter protein
VAVRQTAGPGRSERRYPLTSPGICQAGTLLRIGGAVFFCGALISGGLVGDVAAAGNAAVASVVATGGEGAADRGAATGKLSPRDDAAFVAVIQDTLLVRGHGIADQIFPAVPGVATVIDLERERGGGDLGELLARSAGLQIRRYGGLGAQAVPSLRGSTGAQVQVLVDGLPLADAQSGAIDLSLLPLERFDRVEIHRGLVPVGFGGIGAAGAVNLRSRAHAPGSEALLFTGSFGDLGGRLSHAVAAADGSRHGFLLAHGRRLDNRYPFTPWIPTWSGEAPVLPVEQRRNADLAEAGLFGLAEAQGAAGRARVTAGWFRREGGRPGPQNVPSPDARVGHERLDGRIALATPARALALDVVLSRRRDRLDDPLRQVGHDPFDRTEAVAEEVLGRVTWAPRWHAGALLISGTAGGDWRDQWFQETNDGRSDPLRHRRTVSAFAGVTADVLPLRLAVHPAWRWQRLRDNLPPVPALPWLPEEVGVEHVQDAVSPSLGTSWHAVPGRVILQAHWHETVRPPTWVELFGQPGGMLGNRELAPERITGRDLGLRLSWPVQGAALRVTGFDQITDRTIIYYLAGPGMSRPVNIGRSHTRGLELETIWRRGPADLSLQATWQQARDRGTIDTTYRDKALPYLSDHELYGDLRWRLGDWRPGVAVIHESANYRDRYNLEINKAPARTLWNLSLARVLRGGVWGRGRTATVTAEIVNLTGSQIHDVEGYPLPGRSVRLSCHWR